MLRICINCPHWSFQKAEEADLFWSDESSGTDWSMTCAKDHFFIYGESATEERIRTNLLKAQDCPDFEERKP